MPSCRITNYTTQPLNVSLKHLCALHFENEVVPGQTVKLKPGRVWFTLEVLVDDKNNRYSVAQSAAAIAIVSLACVGSAALAVPAAAAVGGAAAGGTIGSAISAGVGHIITVGGTAVNTVLAAGGSTIGSVGTTMIAGSTGLLTVGDTVGQAVGHAVGHAVNTGGSSLLHVGDTILSGVGTAYTAAQGFLAAHAGAAAKMSAAFLPKAIEVIEEEVGGFNAVQKEVIAILSSPDVSKDVREEGFSILTRLGVALAADRLAAEEEKKKRGDNKDGSSGGVKPGIKRMQTSVSMLMTKISNEVKVERKLVKRSATEPAPSTIDEKPKEKVIKEKTKSILSSSSDTTSIASNATGDKKTLKKQAKLESKDAKSWALLDFDASEAYGEGAGESRMLSTKEKLRIHGLFMNERRHYEIHEKEGKLVLIDANTKETVVVG